MRETKGRADGGEVNRLIRSQARSSSRGRLRRMLHERVPRCTL